MKVFIIPAVLMLVVLLVVGNFSITFRPSFSVSLPGWRMSLAVLALGIGFSLSFAEGYRRGLKSGCDMVFEILKKEIENKDGELDH